MVTIDIKHSRYFWKRILDVTTTVIPEQTVRDGCEFMAQAMQERLGEHGRAYLQARPFSRGIMYRDVHVHLTFVPRVLERGTGRATGGVFTTYGDLAGWPRSRAGRMVVMSIDQGRQGYSKEVGWIVWEEASGELIVRKSVGPAEGKQFIGQALNDAIQKIYEVWPTFAKFYEEAVRQLGI